MTSFSAQMIQSNLFDFTARERTDEAIERAETHADPQWSMYARVCLKSICELKHSFTVDDLCHALSRYDVETHNTSALGAIMRHGAKMGWMKKTEEYTKSKIPAKHMRVIPIWQSLLYKSIVSQQ